jgi:signal transduction histidine kinase/CheY-like chemotaxis protein
MKLKKWYALGLISAFYIFSFVLLIDQSRNTYTLQDKYLFQKNHLQQLKLNLANSHLWTEELISGDTAINIDDITVLLDSIDAGLKSFTQHFDADGQKIPGRLLESTTINLSSYAQRVVHRYEKSVGSDSDDTFDYLYNELLENISYLEKILEEDHFKQLHNNERKEQFQYIWILFLSLIVLVVLYRTFRAQELSEQRLNDFNLELENTVKERTRNLRDAKEEAEAANQSKTDFLANMSHEIRTPMNAILGFIEQLAKKETDPESQKLFTIIRSSGNTLLNIINDILDFSKIENGSIEIEYHHHNTQEFFEEIVSLFSNDLEKKQLKLDSSFPDESPEFMITDKVRLKQVLINLLNNAIKFTPENGTVSLEVKYDPKIDMMLFSVSDTGIGISAQNQEKIFKKFNQADNSTTRKFGGTGLGLSISFQLVRLMGGELQVQSELGKGCRFYFSLPIEEHIEPEAKESKSLFMDDTEEITFEGHVLIVEDNKTNQMLLSMILDDLGLTFDIANDGTEAVKIYQEKSYQVILMDENMPNMNGIEATRHILEIEQNSGHVHTPIVAVTANALKEDRARFLAAGLDDFIAKPYTEEDIVQVLDKYL